MTITKLISYMYLSILYRTKGTVKSRDRCNMYKLLTRFFLYTLHNLQSLRTLLVNCKDRWGISYVCLFSSLSGFIARKHCLAGENINLQFVALNEETLTGQTRGFIRLQPLVSTFKKHKSMNNY